MCLAYSGGSVTLVRAYLKPLYIVIDYISIFNVKLFYLIKNYIFDKQYACYRLNTVSSDAACRLEYKTSHY